MCLPIKYGFGPICGWMNIKEWRIFFGHKLRKMERPLFLLKWLNHYFQADNNPSFLVNLVPNL
jgi:hypothetical protein